MDPITTAIVAALARLSESVIKDAYQGLKSIIVRKVGKDSDLARAVDHLENNPDSAGRAQTLTEEMTAAKMDSDKELLAAVRSILEKLNTTPQGQSNIQQTVTGNQNVFSGTGNITISNRP